MAEFLDWLAMGGYGAYVWSAYGVAIIILSSLGLVLWHQCQKAEQDLKTLKNLPKDDLF